MFTKEQLGKSIFATEYWSYELRGDLQKILALSDLPRPMFSLLHTSIKTFSYVVEDQLRDETN
jgi:hypothetical protein